MSAIVICPECGRDKKRDCFIYDCSYSGCDKKLCSAHCSVTHEDRHIIDPDMLARDNHTWWNEHILVMPKLQSSVHQDSGRCGESAESELNKAGIEAEVSSLVTPPLSNEQRPESLNDTILFKELVSRFDWSRALNLDYITRFFFPNYRRRR